MKIQQLFGCTLALACLLLAGSANAQQTGDVSRSRGQIPATIRVALDLQPSSNEVGYTYFVHGAPGRDLSPDYNPVLPLDVLFNNKDCLVQGWIFGQVRGTYTYPAGSYDVKVSFANSGAPCSNASIYETTLVVFPALSSFAVAAVSPSHTFTGYLFSADLRPLPAGNGRLFVANASAVPTISCVFSPAGPVAFNSITVGTSASVEGLINNYNNFSFGCGIYPGSDSANSLAGVYAQRSNVIGYFVVGSPGSGSLQVLSATIPNVF